MNARSMATAFGVSLLLSGAAGTAMATAGPPPVDGHLYVAASAAPSLAGKHEAAVLRYGLVNGIPQSNSDMRYAELEGPLAVDAAGDLYGLEITESSESVLEYAFGSHALKRTLLLTDQSPPSFYGLPSFTAIALDAAGALYVAQTADQNVYQPPDRCGWQLAVYAPHARNSALPVQCLTVAAPYGIGIDRDGEVYLGKTWIAWNVVAVVSEPAMAPTITRTLFGPSFHGGITATAVDDGGYLYAMVQVYRPLHASSIAVYAPKADGEVYPVRTIDSGASAWTGAMAVWGSRIYVATGSSVLVFDKNASGRADPVATLTFPKGPITFLAVGP